MVGFQQVVGVVVELYLVDSVIGIEAVEEIILRHGCTAGEQGDEDEEEVFESFHDRCFFGYDEAKIHIIVDSASYLAVLSLKGGFHPPLAPPQATFPSH